MFVKVFKLSFVLGGFLNFPQVKLFILGKVVSVESCVTAVDHVLLGALLTLKGLFAYQTMTLFDLCLDKAGQFADIGALIVEWREIVDFQHVLL